MNLKKLAITMAVVLAVAFASQRPLSAQEPPKHHHYKLIDVRTFGGPGSGIENPSSPALNQRGLLVGVSDTSVPDPFNPDCFLDCWVDRAFLVQDGVVTPLQPPPSGAGLSSIAYAINNAGHIVGQAQNGAFDPLTGYPETHAVLWRSGQTIATDLGTLGGTQSIANVINDSGQVVGAALNTTPDPFANSLVASCIYYGPYGGCGTFAQMFLFYPGATETHAFVWSKAQGMQDLGTLGGPDSSAWMINEGGQIAGESFTSFTANASSGVPTIDPFLWDPKQKKMIDLGGLGGTFGTPLWINKRGHVVGLSNPPGDATSHPFLWTEARGMQDLGTFFGPSGFGAALWINDNDEVVGRASTADNTGLVAFLWKDKMLRNLGLVTPYSCSIASSINSLDQIVGNASDCGEELLGLFWENGGPPVDLNTLLIPGTSTFVTAGIVINDAGEIGCFGLDPGDTEAHACLLIPCDENHPGIEGCDYSLVDPSTAAEVRPVHITEPPAARPTKLPPAEPLARFRSLQTGGNRR